MEGLNEEGRKGGRREGKKGGREEGRKGGRERGRKGSWHTYIHSCMYIYLYADRQFEEDSPSAAARAVRLLAVTL